MKLKLFFFFSIFCVFFTAREEFFYRIKLAIDGDRKFGNPRDEVEDNFESIVEDETPADFPRYSDTAPPNIQATYTTKIFSLSSEGSLYSKRRIVSRTERTLYGKYSSDINVNFLPSSGIDTIVSPSPNPFNAPSERSYVLEFRSSMPSCLFGLTTATFHDNDEIYIRNLVKCDGGPLRLSPVADEDIKAGIWGTRDMVFSDIAKSGQFLY